MTHAPVLDETRPGGIRERVFRFDNGFGASAVTGSHPWLEAGKANVAALRYDTGVADDGYEVLPSLGDLISVEDMTTFVPEAELDSFLDKIAGLPSDTPYVPGFKPTASPEDLVKFAGTVGVSPIEALLGLLAANLAGGSNG